MKKLILAVLAIVLGCYTMSAQSMKVVVSSSGEVQGRYVRTNASTYTVSVQDHGEVPIAGNHIEEYSAERGQGVVYRNYSTTNNIRVRQGPSTETSVIGIIRDEKGMTPDVFDCLGKENGWYKIRFGGKVAYVRYDLMEWDAINSF